MITAVLDDDGNALMGVDGYFVHLGGDYKVYRKPHHIKTRARWARQWSTDEMKIEATEDGWRVDTSDGVLEFGYHLWGFELLMSALVKYGGYRKRKFSNDHCVLIRRHCRG